MTIKIKPSIWTPHHTHRIVHMSILGASVGLVLTVMWLGLLVVWDSYAYDKVESDKVKITAVVSAVTAEPAVSSGTLATDIALQAPNVNIDIPIPTSDVQAPEQEPLIQVAENVDVTQETVTINGHTEVVPVFHSQSPAFSGATVIKNAIIFLEVHSSQVIRGTTYADSEGRWHWEPPIPLSPGPHTIRITSQDPDNAAVRDSSSLDFYIRLPVGVQPILTPVIKPLLVPDIGNRKVLFDVLVKIPSQFQTLQAGQEVLAKVRLINFGAVGSPVDVGVQYTIQDAAGNVVSETSETIAVATQISLLKTFVIKSNLPPGVYKLTVRVPTEDALAVSTDTFEIKPNPLVGSTTPSAAPDYSFTFQILLSCLFLFCIICYFEYNKVVTLSRFIRQVSEQDLQGQV